MWRTSLLHSITNKASKVHGNLDLTFEVLRLAKPIMRGAFQHFAVSDITYIRYPPLVLPLPGMLERDLNAMSAKAEIYCLLHA